MTDSDDKSMALRALGFALDIDRGAARRDVQELKAKHPSKSRRELADKLMSRSRWKATGMGVLTGLPANPLAAVPAAMADVGVLLLLNVNMAARVALLFDDTYLDDPEPPYELLVPIFGGTAAAELGRELAIRGGMGVTRHAIRKVLSKSTLKAFKRIMLKYFGMKVTQRAVIAKTLPVVGGLIGGTWNFVEVRMVAQRTYAYFDGKPLAEKSE